MAEELKFLLVGHPATDSVWLHLSTAGILGVSVWIDHRLRLAQAPVDWLAPIVQFAATLMRHPKDIVSDKPILVGFLNRAGKLGTQGILNKSRTQLVESMRTQFACQRADGWSIPKINSPNTLARVYSREVSTNGVFLIRLTHP